MMTTKAQDIDKGFIGIAAGPSIPTSNFADKSSTNPKAGFATNGFVLDLATFCHKITNNFGICANWFGEVCKQDNTNNPNGDISANWTFAAINAGPSISVNAGKIVEFDLRPMVGLADAIYDQPGASVNNISYAFSYDLGGTLRINPLKKITIIVNADYFSVNPKFKDAGFQQQITTLGISFGLGWRFY